MILLNDNKSEAITIGNITENKVGIDIKNIDFITTLLTSNLYQKPFASFLRETVSNAVDSNKEAKSDIPVLILLKNSNYSNDRLHYWDYVSIDISIRDYGTGLSPERFNEIYRNIGSSTKRESNDYIGCFGIGRFSCLSCSDTANITSYYNGKKYSYIMYKNNNKISIDLLNTTETTEKNGLEVNLKTSVKISDIQCAINELWFFDNIYIHYKSDIICLTETVDKFNSRKKYEYNNFVANNTELTSGYYVKMGNVLYKTTGGVIQGLNNDIFIDVPMGSIDITPNRENIQETQRTIEVIKKKVVEANKELVSLFENAIKEENFTLTKYYNTFATGHIVWKLEEYFAIELEINKLPTINLKNCKINGFEVPENFYLYLNSLGKREIYKGYVYKILDNGYKFQKRIANIIQGDYTLILKDDRVRQKTIQWFKDKCCTRKGSYILCSNDNIDLLLGKGYSCIHQQCNIDECLELLKKFLNIGTLSDNDVPRDYKAKSTYSKKEQIRIYNRYGYSIVDFDVLEEDKSKFIIYTKHSRNDDTLKALAQLGSPNYYNNFFRVITVKEESLKFFQNKQRFINYDNILYKKNKLISKFVEAKIIIDFFAGNYEGTGYYYSKFKVKYNMYVRILTDSDNIYNTKIIKLISYFKDKGFYDKDKVDYFINKIKKEEQLRKEVKTKLTNFLEKAEKKISVREGCELSEIKGIIDYFKIINNN